MEEEYILSEIRRRYDANYGRSILYDEFKEICLWFYRRGQEQPISIIDSRELTELLRRTGGGQNL